MRYWVLVLGLTASWPTLAQARPAAQSVAPALEDSARIAHSAQDAMDERILERSRRAMGSICTGCGLDPSMTRGAISGEPSARSRSRPLASRSPVARLTPSPHHEP